MKNLEYYEQDIELSYNAKRAFEKSKTKYLVDWLQEEHQILDNTEKRYLKEVIRPFKDNIESITKVETIAFNEETVYRIRITFASYCKDNMRNYLLDLPLFRRNVGMYDGMEPNRTYKLEELGLND